MNPLNELIVRVLPHMGDDATFFANNSWRFPRKNPSCNGVRFVFDESEEPDISLVLNYLKYDSYLSARPGGIWRWDNEPIVDKKSLGGFDHIFTHERSIPGNLRVTASPVLDWWVKKDFDELISMPIPSKTKLMSAIASNRAMLPGHIARREFIDLVEARIPEVDVFGSGRAHELSDKWDGLAPYKFSIAIENTSAPDYWTEKVADCFLAYTVPLYYGATNLSNYFPPESYIELPIERQDFALDRVKEVLQGEDWEWRVPFLEEAREAVLNRYSFAAQISYEANLRRESLLSGGIERRMVQGRRKRRGGWRRGIGLWGNMKLQVQRYFRRARKTLRQIKT